MSTSLKFEQAHRNSKCYSTGLQLFLHEEMAFMGVNGVWELNACPTVCVRDKDVHQGSSQLETVVPVVSSFTCL